MAKEPDRLNIREVKQELDFHYNREERLNMPGAPPPKTRLSFFRRNRALVIIFIDIIVLVILGMIFSSFNFGTPESLNLGDYRLVLRAMQYEDVVFATLTVRNRSDGNRSDGNRSDGNRSDGNRSDGNRSDGRILVRFILSDQRLKKSDLPDAAGQFAHSAELPAAPGDESILKEAIALFEGASRLYAEVRIGEDSRLLLKDFDN